MYPPTQQILEALTDRGWIIEQNGSATFELPEPIKSRYPIAPSSLVEFLTGLKVCANANQTAWFLCHDDFTGQTDSGWHWDSFETMLLEWAETEQEQKIVRDFWDTHFPFLLSVHTGYAFFAINLRAETQGHVVHVLMEYGVDEPSIVASSFEEFMTLLLAGKFPAEVGSDLAQDAFSAQ